MDGNLREIILSLEKPVVFRGMIDDWKVLSWNLEHWGSLFQSKVLPFRSGLRRCSVEPQWERVTDTVHMTMNSFIERTVNCSSLKETQNWLYFDYKYMHEWLMDDSAGRSMLESISWNKFGFPECSGRDSTLWIGSEGAHTPCHMDTYGCNLVAQIYGTKQWILFPPQEGNSLRTSRVPYEESSIYSQLNFNSPLSTDVLNNIQNVYILNLQPGDVLFVPRHWWHYVESLSTSISINTWLPLSEDNLSRVDESLVRFFVSQVCQSLDPALRDGILNPNEENISSATIHESVELVSTSVEKAVHDLAEKSQANEPPRKKMKKTASGEGNLRSSIISLKSFNATFVPQSTSEDLKSLLDLKCKCLSEELHGQQMRRLIKTGGEKLIIPHESCAGKDQELALLLPKLINAFCHPDVIAKVKSNLLEKM